MKKRKIKKEVIIFESDVMRARIPNAHDMTLAKWRLFVDRRIPYDTKEMYIDFEGNYHFISYSYEKEGKY